MNSSVIKARNIMPESDFKVINSQLSLDLAEGAVANIIGPEASGKSIWLKTLNGFNPLVQGELNLLQYDVRQLNREDWLNLQKQISYIGSDTVLLSAFTLKENILLPGLYHKLDSQQALTRLAYQLLSDLGFEDQNVLDELPAFATPLQNYYVKLARALIVKPRLLLMDDMAFYANPSRVYKIKQTLSKVIDNAGMSLVTITADEKQVFDESSKIIFTSPNYTAVFDNRQQFILSSETSVKEYLSRNSVH